MAGAMRKMGIYLGLVEDDEERHRDHYSVDDYDDYEPERPPARTERPDRGGVRSVDRLDHRPDRTEREPAGRDGISRVALRERLAADPAPTRPYRITTLHPRTYNEARTIGEHFRESVPVIMNLTEMDDADAKRLVDFAAGLSFGLRGSIERVTNKVFLLSPVNVEVTAEDKARIAEGGFFNQS